MSNKQKTKKIVKKILTAVFSLLTVTAIAFSAVVINDYLENRDNSSSDNNSVISTDSTLSEPKPIVKLATATVSSTGDLLMHKPIITNAKQGDDYDFSNIFTYFGDYVKMADYAVANLETTLRGSEKAYSGYPQFNCPDSITTAVKNAGFDMLLTANNHSYDTGLTGFKRTLEIVDGANLDRLGTNKTTDEPKYIVKDINGINIGMTCYTYETATDKENRKALNGILLSEEAGNLVNSFSYSNLDKFYSELEVQLKGMKAQGAEATVVYIHWGEEYTTKATKEQVEIAQKLCDLGVDVIVGGHAHVVEPVDLLTSTANPDHKTVCIYSLGNAVSNQRKQNMKLKTGHTEDGVLFSFSFAKYSDGTVMLDSVTLLPTWVNMYTADGKRIYEIIPLDKQKTDWQQSFDLSDANLINAQKSYDRTMEIVGEGLEKVQNYINGLSTPLDKVA